MRLFGNFFEQCQSSKSQFCINSFILATQSSEQNCLFKLSVLKVENENV